MTEGRTPESREAQEPRAPEADSFVAKWLAREPALELAVLFCPAPQRRLASLWSALANELDEAVFELSDRSVAQVKLAWWGEELTHAAQGEVRHPLVREFFEQAAARDVAPARWAALAHAGLRLATDEGTPADSAESVARMMGYAQVLAEIESTLLGAATPAAALAIERLLRQWPKDASSSRLRWPLQLRARHQMGPNDAAPPRLRRDYAADLLELLEPHSGGFVLRRGITALIARHLQELARGNDAAGVSRWRALWTIWRAARRP